MAKVKINTADYRTFAEAAETTGRSIEQWLAEAGHAQALRQAQDTRKPAVHVPGHPDEVWKATVSDLADEIPSSQQRAYLQLTRLHAIVEDTALLAVPDAFTRDVIESRLRPAVTHALSRRLNRPIQVAVTVTGETAGLHPPDAR